MRRAALLAATTLLAAGCGSGAARPAPHPKPPRIPHALAQSWAQQADAVSSALAAGDGCTARTRATALQQQVIAAVNARRVPQRLLEPLSGGVNDLVGRITCTPAAQPVVTQPSDAKPPKQEHKHDRGHGHGHGQHGHDGGD